jgi:hypothetical protein
MIESVPISDEHASFAAYEAIAATLQRYIDGARAGDGTLMRRAFLEAAHIRGSYGGGAYRLDIVRILRRDRQRRRGG